MSIWKDWQIRYSRCSSKRKINLAVVCSSTQCDKGWFLQQMGCGNPSIS